MRSPLPNTNFPNPGASATATIYDSGAPPVGSRQVPGGAEVVRVRVAVFMDQAATFFCKWAAPGSSNLRTFNGGGSGEAISVNTFFERDVLMMPGRNQITIVTVTGPTVWEVGAELVDDQALAQ